MSVKPIDIYIGADLSGKVLNMPNFPYVGVIDPPYLYNTTYENENYEYSFVILKSENYYINYEVSREYDIGRLEHILLYDKDGNVVSMEYNGTVIFNIYATEQAGASVPYNARIVDWSYNKTLLPEDFGEVIFINENFSKYFQVFYDFPDPIYVEGNDYVDVFNEKYQEIAKRNRILPKFKIQLLDTFENVVDEITGDISTNNQGSISINYQQGVRRSITLTFIDTTGKFLPDANGNIIWMNKKFKAFVGLKDSETEKIYWFSQGVYYFTNSISNRTGGNKTTTITGVDKFGIFGSELGYNQLESTYLIPAGTNIYEAIKGILNLDLGNGYPIDPIEPILDPVFKDEVCPYDVSKAPSSYLSEILIELADILGSDIYYDGTGRLRIDNGTIDASYSNKSAIWDFNDVLQEYIDPAIATNFVDFINTVKVVGNNVNDKIYEYTAYNNNPNSPTRIDLIGRKLKYIESAAVYNEERAKDYAEYKLNTLSILQLAINFSCTFLPHLDVNKVVSVTDKYFNYDRQRFIIQSITIPLSFDGVMSISACSLSFLPYYEEGAG